MHRTDSLAERVRGPILVPADAGYDEERSGFQLEGRHRPEVIVGATGPDDVRAAVELAVERGLPVAVQATGHGLAAAGGGVLISTRRMADVRVDAARRTAWIGAGARWEQVIEAAAPHGLAPLSGSSPHVGAVGYTLAGGLGLMGRRFGYAADHVRSVDVVTADGQARRVTAGDEPDLFWALRGGGGNAGVVTGMEVDLAPVARLYGGGLYFGADLVPAVLDAWRRWTDTVPDELTSSTAVLPFPDVPAMPEPLRGRYAVHVRVAFTGPAAEGERLVAPLRAVGPRLIDRLGDMPYSASGTIHNDPPVPHGYRGTGVLVRDLQPASLPSIVELAGPDAPLMCVVQTHHLGGALARRPAVPNAVGHRDARYVLRVLSPVEPDQVELARGVHDRLLAEFAPWTLGTTLGFTFGPSTASQVRSAFSPGDYERLRTLKARYDPANTFRLNHKVPPA